MKTIFTAIAALLLGAVSAPAAVMDGAPFQDEHRQHEKDIRLEKVAKALEKREYVIEMDFASGMGGRQVTLSSGYRLTVKEGRATAGLPFYGRAYSLPYGSGGGIDFDEEEILEYTSKTVEGKKGKSRTEISFKVSAAGDVFSFYVTVFPDGTVSASVNSNNRVPMNYRGKIIFPADNPKGKS